MRSEQQSAQPSLEIARPAQMHSSAAIMQQVNTGFPAQIAQFPLERFRSWIEANWFGNVHGAVVKYTRIVQANRGTSAFTRAELNRAALDRYRRHSRIGVTSLCRDVSTSEPSFYTGGMVSITFAVSIAARCLRPRIWIRFRFTRTKRKSPKNGADRLALPCAACNLCGKLCSFWAPVPVRRAVLNHA